MSQFVFETFISTLCYLYKKRSPPPPLRPPAKGRMEQPGETNSFQWLVTEARCHPDGTGLLLSPQGYWGWGRPRCPGSSMLEISFKVLIWQKNLASWHANCSAAGFDEGPSTFGWGSRHSIQGTKSTPHLSAPHPSHRTSRQQEASPGSVEAPSPSGSNLSTPTKLLPGTGQGWQASRKGMALVSCAWLVPNGSL